MSALSPDYDSDPERSRSFQAGWQEDVHGPVAKRLVSDGVGIVLDVGCGIGRFGAAVRGRLCWLGLDMSPRQLADCTVKPVIRADAVRLPIGNGRVDAVTMLWMLYHLDEPRDAISEARRVLRRGGLLAACASSRTNDPELVPYGYPRTSFDAEEAADIVSDVFGASNVELERWDAPLVQLTDREEVAAYARSHLLPPTVVEAVTPPVTLTKRGCLVWAKRP
ncbi:MAG: class I SAM-dependent methyltransferase [Acidimicrobiales bacterium]|nr:class I SAM-dependent methyltransferase [Acidimicrobiales bacterium]